MSTETARPTAEIRQTAPAETAPPAAQATQPAPAVLSGTNLPELMNDPLLAELDMAGNYPANPVLGNAELQRGQIATVNFLPSLADMGEGAWDVSRAKDGSVMAWATPNGELYDLCIAGEGGVRFPSDDPGAMFAGYSNAYSINFNGCVDFSRVSSMQGLFDSCISLTSIDLSTLDTSCVTNMMATFNNCSSLVSVNLEGIDTSNVTTMEMLFSCCVQLRDVNLNALDVSNVENFYGAFSECHSLTEPDLSSWKFNRYNITMDSMFEGCHNMQRIILPEGFVSNRVNDTHAMFNRCNALIELDVSSWDTSSVTNMCAMFGDCNSLQALDVGGWNTSNVTNMDSMFRSCAMLSSLDVSGWNTSNVATMAQMFACCSQLRDVNLNALDVSNVENFCLTFQECDSFTELDLSSWNPTRESITMEGMFEGCHNMQRIILPEGFVSSRVNNTRAMFNCCNALIELDVSSWDTSSVTDMCAMFGDCNNLQALDAGGWNTSNVTNMGWMFCNCFALSSLDVSGWDTSNVTEMTDMFTGCEALPEMNLNA